MAGRGRDIARINDVADLYSHLGLLERLKPWPDYSGIRVTELRGLSYEDQWKQIFGADAFHLLLTDYSLIQYRWTRVPSQGRWPSFTYMECPYAVPSMEEFAQAHFGSDAQESLETLSVLYSETALEQASLKDSAVPIRYDYDPLGYAEGVHPASHVHVGDRTQIRLATKRLFRPMTFGLFILRQVYPGHWRLLTLDDARMARLAPQIRDGLADVPSEYFGPKDKWEHQLA